jgi:hypothetical protein
MHFLVFFALLAIGKNKTWAAQSAAATNCLTNHCKLSRPLISALMDWRATLRPEMVSLKNWPNVQPGHFQKKRLWQKGLYDHVIRKDVDLQENIDYIVMNRARRVRHPPSVLSVYWFSVVGAALRGRPRFIFRASHISRGVATECHHYNRTLVLRDLGRRSEQITLIDPTRQGVRFDWDPG